MNTGNNDPSVGPRIEKVVVKNYRCLRSAAITLNPGLNIIVGDNEAGKSTFLEAIHLALTCQVNGRALRNQLHPHLFNEDVVAEFCTKVNDGQKAPPPEVLIELYFADGDEWARLRGTNNSESRDAPGVRLTIKLDDVCGDEYAAHLSLRNLAAIPVEFYTIEWMTFANEPVHPRRLPTRSRLIDATTVIGERGTSRYLLDVVSDDLDGAQRSRLALAYRLLKADFSKHEDVAALNEVLAARVGDMSKRSVTISLDTTATGSWQNAVVPMLDDVPFSLVGKGEQAALRLRLAVDAASTADVILVEEPENHQSHPRLNRLLDGFRAAHGRKQFVVSTHSSFVVNKLGISEVLMFARGQAVRLSDLPKDTGRYFMRLPGHDTLRLILAERAILVEGPSDELVVQRAYRDKHGKMPLDAGVEVISVGALAFKRFMAIAEVVKKVVVIVTDNDGKPAEVRRRYATDASNIKVCVSEDADLPSLEQQLVASNSLATLNAALKRNFATVDDARTWMIANKTDAALRIFESVTTITYPQYILDAVDE